MNYTATPTRITEEMQSILASSLDELVESAIRTRVLENEVARYLGGSFGYAAPAIRDIGGPMTQADLAPLMWTIFRNYYCYDLSWWSDEFSRWYRCVDRLDALEMFLTADLFTLTRKV